MEGGEEVKCYCLEGDAPDDEHMCSKHVEAWNKLNGKQKLCASSWLITEIKKTITSVILILLTCTAFYFFSSISCENVAVLKYFEMTVKNLRCNYK